MANFKIAPVNRLEGHLDLDVTTSGTTNGIVTDVKTMCVMFRGIENIMLRRDPRDAPIIAPRT